MNVGAPALLTALAMLWLAGCSSNMAAQATGGNAGNAGAASGGATSAGSATGGTAGGGAASGGTAGGGAVTGGMVKGPVNTRCEGRAPYKVNPNGCFLQVEPPEFSNGGTAGSETSGGSGGVTDCNFAHDAGYGDPLFNDAGDDDECKYHVTWSSTPIQKDQPFTLTVTATNKITGQPLENLPDQMPGTVALSRMEPYVPCDAVHLPPTSTLEAPVTQTGPGTFSLGPVVLDESARWAMRFHFYGDCFNNSATPHAHIAFFVDVP